MKLENCDWVPSHVVHWLSKKLEEQGIPAATYTHTLLSYLHPYFCPYPVVKYASPKSCVEKDLPSFEDFDDSIDSDADFPQDIRNITENKTFNKKVEKNQSRREIYFKKAVECLSSASNKIEELVQLVEELFDLLERALNESRVNLSLNKESSSNPASFQNFGRINFLSTGRSLGSSVFELPLSQLISPFPRSPSDVPRVLKDNIKDDRSRDFNLTMSEPPEETNLPMNSDRSTINMMGGGESITDSFSDGDAPLNTKEEWEYLAQLVNAQNATPQQGTAGRLFERSGGVNDAFHNSPGLGLSRFENLVSNEPWEDSISLWKAENTVNANNQFSEPLSSTFGQSFTEYGDGCTTLPDNIEQQLLSDRLPPSRIWEPQNPIGSKGTTASREGNANERSPNVGKSSIFVVDDTFPSEEYIRQKHLETELSKSFRQLGIDIWKDQQDFIPGTSEDSRDLQFNSIRPENRYKLPVKDVRDSDLFCKIPRGPVGPYPALNHTETSGFSSVIPQRDLHIARNSELKGLDSFGRTDSYVRNPLEEKENLLTSPRTHFKPIKQDSQGSSEEYKDEVQVVSEAQTGFQNPDLLFQRTGSGNFILESDFVEGSPRKYMIYKEPQSKIAVNDSPDGLEVSPISNLDANAVSFAPKFKISNNEKFSQTELSSNMLTGTANFAPFSNDILKNACQKNTDFIWESNFQENIKKIWNEDDSSGKEIWEIGLENMSMEFACSGQSWSKEEGRDPPEDSIPLKNFFKKRDLEGSDVLSRIKVLWPRSSKDVENSSRQTGESLLQADSYLDSSWNNSDLGREGESQTGLYGAISLDTHDDNSHVDPLRSKKLKDWGIHDIDDMNLVPGGSPTTTQQFDTSGENDGAMEDLEILEPDWDLNEGFEWDPTMIEEMSAQGEVFYCEVDGQQVMLPVEYLEEELYDKYFGTSETLGGSLPDLPYTETADGKKIPFKIKRKTVRAAHSSRPCTFFLEGNCLRTDCKFSHDFSAITCRFWEENSCFKAETCPFLHGYPTHRKRNRSEGDQISNDPVTLAKLKETMKGSKGRTIMSGRPPSNSFEITSEADFPSLGSSFESRTSSLEEISTTTYSKSSGRKAKFVAVPNTFIKQIDVKGATAKGGSQRRKKSKYGNARTRSQISSEHLDSKARNTYKSDINSPKHRRHDDGTVSDF